MITQDVCPWRLTSPTVPELDATL
uniref:Uncharacterized protein n=1 Tax=Anguilla anguilla TaxID=7936 RepID=A0A0E9U3L6_ANGAN